MQRRIRSRRYSPLPWAIVLLLALTFTAAACGGDDDDDPGPTVPAPSATTATGPTGAPPTAPAASPTPDIAGRLAGVPGIVDPTNLGWPREVEGLNGRVTIAEQPQRIHTTSAGIDEITIALVSVSRIAAVGNATKNPDTSSFAEEVKDLPVVAREPEAIASVNPDVVIATTTQRAEVIAAIEAIEIPVVQLALDPEPQGRIDAILLLGYIYGEEERAIALADEVQGRYDAVVAEVATIAESERPVVLATTKYTSVTISGTGTTLGGIIEAAGGINGADRAGVSGTQQASYEAFVAINPEVIILPMAAGVGEPFRAELLAEAALAEVPAVRDGRVYVVPSELYTTLSFANVRGIEHLAHLLWPEHFPSAETPQFSLPAGR